MPILELPHAKVPCLHGFSLWLRRPRRVHTLLFLMALALILPAMIFTGFLAMQSAAVQRAEINQRLEQVAADLANTVDRDLERMLTLLDTLALSERLAQRDFAGFQTVAAAAVRRLGAHIVVLDAAGRPLMNTRVPFGTLLPPTSDQASLEAVRTTNGPVVSNLLFGRVANRHVFNVVTPLHLQGLTNHVLIMSVDADHLLELMQGLYLPPAWVLGITDRQGIIVARSSGHDAYVGKPLRPDLLAASQRETSAFSAVNVEGVPSLRAVARSKLSGWLVSANVPAAMIDAEIQSSQKNLALEALGLSILALGLASVFGRWIVKPIQELANTASTLQADDIIPPFASPVAEANEVAEALRRASIELKSRAARLHQSELRLDLAQRTAGLAYVDLELNQQTATVSDTFEEIFGFRPDSGSVSTTLQSFLDRVHPDDRERVRGVRALASAKVGAYEDEFRIVLPDGGVRWISAHGETLGDQNGKPVRMIGTHLDITRRKEQENHIGFLLREVSHRAKNLLAIIQAMASQTARTSPTYEAFQSRFSQRLQGMAASHDLLVSQNWQGVDLAELVRAQLLTFAEESGGRLVLTGPPIFLTPMAAQSIGLALHELATNATKYGAWSMAKGRVRIAWQIVTDSNEPRFQMTWREFGGPDVKGPERQGFGHTVFERMIKQALSASIRLGYVLEGVTWTLDAALSSVTQQANSVNAAGGETAPIEP